MHRLIFHYWQGRGYFEEAQIRRRVTSPRIMFRWDEEPASAAATASHVYWVTEPRYRPRPDLIVAAENGADRHVLVHRVDASNLLIAGSYLYWSAAHGVGRVHLDGSGLVRHYIHLPQAGGGGDVADGLATDGTYLYFAQCIHTRIGKVPLAVGSAHPTVTWVAPFSDCPQGLAYADGYLYYGVGGWIGRIRTNGQRQSDQWRRAPHGGPGDLVTDSKYLYWDYCYGARCIHSHLARMTITGNNRALGLFKHVDQGLTLAP